MTNQDFSRSRSLNNLSSRKLQLEFDAINNNSNDLRTKSLKLTIANRYAESNIPLGYWTLKMDQNFKGDPRLLSRYQEYVADLKQSYAHGTSLCLAGKHGSGKTMVLTCILKKTAHMGFSCLYTTLSDVVNALTHGDSDVARRELMMVDFLALDEVDLRFFNQSDSSNELFARSFEPVLRTRIQNALPILMATNSPNINENFATMFKDSIGSLMSRIEIFSVMPGKDFRKEFKP